jgi:hypothetical protein
MNIQRLSIASIALLLLTGCCGLLQPEPQTVLQTVVHTQQVPVTQIVEVPVTQIVEVEVEVTRPVEVTREVTRQVEITRIVRLTVERLVTATPEPTPIPEPTATRIAATAVPAVPTAQLLASMRTARQDMERFGGLIDVALRDGYIDCQEVVDLYAKIAASPTYDVSRGSDAVRNAYNSYRTAIDVFVSGARDLNQNCRDFLASGGGGGIPFQQWGVARQQVNQALSILIPAIESIQ